MSSWKVDPKIANGLALAGSTTAVLMWVAPFKEMFVGPRSVRGSRSSRNIPSAFVFSANVFNSLLWLVYASTKLETMTIPFIVNLAGIVLNLSFAICFAWFADSKQKRRDMYKQFCVFALFSAWPIRMKLLDPKDDAADALVGYSAALVNIIMMFGPLAAASDVLKTRTTKGLFPLSIAMGFLSSAIWVAYGIYLRETPSIITNVLGILSSLIQLGLYSWASRAEQLDESRLRKKEL